MRLETCVVAECGRVSVRLETCDVAECGQVSVAP